LLHLLRQKGFGVAGMKPVASGAEETAAGLRNEDALAIQQAAPHSYELINPYCFREPVAPSLAATAAGCSISLQHLGNAYADLAAASELVLVEGVGGWRVPWNEHEDAGHFCRQQQLGVILVVGLRLGCINHSLLSVEAIAADQVPLLGWVANAIEADMLWQDRNIELLRSRIAAPLLGRVPLQPQPRPDTTARYLTDAGDLLAAHRTPL
jgi:dethiobiotin synthetase